MEIFETDLGSDEDDPVKKELIQENRKDQAGEEGERGGNYGELERGKDIIDEEVSTDRAIKIFMELEQQSE